MPPIQHEVYNAAAQKLDDNTTRTNYVQVADNRGTFSGWNLKVQMTDFTTADSNLVANGHGTLTGATVTLGDVYKRQKRKRLFLLFQQKKKLMVLILKMEKFILMMNISWKFLNFHFLVSII